MLVEKSPLLPSNDSLDCERNGKQTMRLWSRQHDGLSLLIEFAEVRVNSQLDFTDARR